MFLKTFCHAIYSKRMEDFMGFGMKISLTLPNLGFKHFISLNHEDDESI